MKKIIKGTRYKKRQTRVAINFFIYSKFIFISMICAFIFLGFNLWKVQINGGDKYKDLAKKNRIRRVIIPARRGNIYDRNGILLVENRPSFNVSITKEDFKENKDLLLEKLSRILDLSPQKITSRIYSKSYFSYMPSKVARDITLERLTAIEEASPALPGVITEVEPVRFYKHGHFLSHLLGKVGKISQTQYKEWRNKGYIMSDIVGKGGIESAYETYLRGISGGMQVQVDHKGSFDEIINIRKPIPGNNLYLTIDKNLQDVLEETYRENTGAAVVINPNNGELLAIISKPDFDPNIFVSHKSIKEVKAVLTDPNFPLVNKAIAGEFPAGSLFKIIVALAALQGKVISENTVFTCTGVFNLGRASFKCWKKEGHGTFNIRQALMQSCNVFFYNTGKALGNIPIYEMAQKFGLGEKTGIEILGERAGINPDGEWKKMHCHESWYGGDTINLSIGQGYLLTTPLQLAVMISAVANNGTLYKPITVRRVVSPAGKIIATFNPSIKREIDLNPKELKIVKEGLVKVVNDRHGTARRAKLKDVIVAGKTGTIQVTIRGKKNNHAWFACFAPAEKPEIAAVFLVEYGRSGGFVAAPLAKKVLRAYFTKPSNNTKEEQNAA